MQRRETLLLLLIGLGLAAYLFWPSSRQTADYAPLTGMSLIAHAGGGLATGTYSNAQEALDQSAEHGFAYIEVDLHWTGDGDLVLIHDWQTTHVDWFLPIQRWPGWLDISRWARAPTAEAFTRRNMRRGLTPMSLPDLLAWMQEHPDIRIVTDLKERHLAGLETISEQAPSLLHRFIPQIYAPSDYSEVRGLGYDDIILTAYQTDLTGEELARFAGSHDLLAVTVPAGRLSPAEIQQIRETGTPVWAHTVNSTSAAEELRKAGVSGLYTDYLYPEPAAGTP